jgi:type IV pilus assembly protein PilQ
MKVFAVAMFLGSLQEPAASSESTQETLIDIDVREADARDVLRLLAEVGGFNLAVDPGVTCDATLKLKQVPWPQVLDLALRTCGLEQERLGENLVRVAPAEEIRKEYQERRKYQEEKALAGPLETRYVRLAYARAKDVAPMLSKFLSPRGSVVFDERTNTLIVTDIRR